MAGFSRWAGGAMNRRGSFAVEFVLSVFIWIALFSGLLTLGRLVVVRHRALSLARLGTLLFSTSRVEPEMVRTELERVSHLVQPSLVSQWNFDVRRFQETPASHFYQLVQTRVEARMKGFLPSLTEKLVTQQEDANL